MTDAVFSTSRSPHPEDPTMYQGAVVLEHELITPPKRRGPVARRLLTYCCQCSSGPVGSFDVSCLACGHHLFSCCDVYSEIYSNPPVRMPEPIQALDYNEPRRNSQENDSAFKHIADTRMDQGIDHSSFFPSHWKHPDIQQEISLQHQDSQQRIVRGQNQSAINRNPTVPNNSMSATPRSSIGESSQSATAKKPRKLSTMKCDRCRYDKQKCVPIVRMWPNKCDRCAEKGLPCSENTKTTRKTKHSETSTTPQSRVPSDSSQPLHQETLLRQWSSLLQYSECLSASIRAHNRLRRQTLAPFIYKSPSRSCNGGIYERIPYYVNKQIPRMLEQCAIELLNSQKSNTTLSGSALPILMGQSLSRKSGNLPCRLCRATDEGPVLRHLSDIGDVGGVYAARQSCIRTHVLDSHEGHADSEVLLANELSQNELLEISCKSQVAAMFKNHGSFDAEVMALKLNVFYDEALGSKLFTLGFERLDCLGRSTLHQWLDSHERECDPKEFKQLWRPSMNINKQDLLGRSALHIACLNGWTHMVDTLLELGAKPDFSTVYGHLPIHYAVARPEGGEYVCSLLLTDYDWRKVDCFGKSAIDYARLYGNIGLLGMLHSTLMIESIFQYD